MIRKKRMRNEFILISLASSRAGMNRYVILRPAAAYKHHPHAASAAEGILENFARKIDSASPAGEVQDPYVASLLRMTRCVI
jgi:hypothetical protein